MRDVGAVGLFQDWVPEALAFPIAMLTQLGAIWFAILVIAVVFVAYSRRDALVIGGLLLAGTGIWRTIKIVFPVDRPDHPFVLASDFPFVAAQIFELAVVNTGPGFPSGHAVTTTVLYLSLARYVKFGPRWGRYLIAVGMIALVGFTRVTLGVHFVTDVFAGALIGHTLLMGSHQIFHRVSTDRVTVSLTLGLFSASVCLLANVIISPIGLWEIGLFLAAASTFSWWLMAGQQQLQLSIPTS